MLEALRLFLMVGAVVNVLLSTVLYRAVGRPFIDWYTRLVSLPDGLQRLLSRDVLVRAWGLGTAAVNVAVWWYLGTADGEAFFRGLTPR
jgi:hypothetical protein